MDSVSAAAGASFGLTPNNNPAVLNDALKGNVTISVVQDLVSASTDEGSLAPTIYKLHVKDEYGGLYVIPATPTMTINEIKQEALRRYGIIDFINRHDIFGIDQNHQDVVLDYLNTSVGSLARLANAHMQFHLRRKKPVSWSIPVFVHEKNTYRQIAVNAFTTVEQVVAIIVALENIDKSVSNNYAIYNQKGSYLIPLLIHGPKPKNMHSRQFQHHSPKWKNNHSLKSDRNLLKRHKSQPVVLH
ncbi:hypothetical protein BDR26DRAFT_257561 [Obelidium mucronatum]|nr:hypothetical protein BDR26DRAFT_257561 [Obelidium mucronatum]